MTASILVALAILIGLALIGIGLGMAVRSIGDRIADRITDNDHELGETPL